MQLGVKQEFWGDGCVRCAGVFGQVAICVRTTVTECVCVLQECFLSGGDWPVQQLRELCLPGVLCGSECAAHMQLLLLYCS